MIPGAANSDQFVILWIVWGLLGLGAAIWLFAWAMRTRQFVESRRASLIPLDDVDVGAPLPSRGAGRFHWYFILALTALAISLIVLMVTLAVRASLEG